MHGKRNYSKTYYIVIGTYKVSKKMLFLLGFFNAHKNKTIKIDFFQILKTNSSYPMK